MDNQYPSREMLMISAAVLALFFLERESEGKDKQEVARVMDAVSSGREVGTSDRAILDRLGFTRMMLSVLKDEWESVIKVKGTRGAQS